MKRNLFFLVFLFYLVSPAAESQVIQGPNGVGTTVSSLFSVKTERYFRFLVKEKKEIGKLTGIISIDKIKGDTVWAYANRKQFETFVQLGYEVKILPNPGDLMDPVLVDKINLKDRTVWNFYPTYTAYLDLLSQFQSNYPELCKIDTIGVLSSGRLLLAAKISDNVASDEGEPEFLYTATMHGDETTGYVLMLHLMDYLLLNYGVDPRVTDMVNNMEIWINPLANPDGTYAGGNNTVYGATRYNGNGVDLNRNYPDPEDGPHPDGEEWQPETVAFMNFAAIHQFVMAANFHGGTEVYNYPWDTWPRLHPDNNWWVYTGRQYVDTVHLYSPGNYMNEYDNGITNGYAWYEVAGGRQDYMNYFWHCREVTIELSDEKLLAPGLLVAHWDYNYRSFLNYIDQSRFGIRGTVTDSLTGNPLRAKVFVDGHDMDSSYVYSSGVYGDYYRPIKAGNYSLTFSAPCYHSKTISNIGVADLNATILNVELNPYVGLAPEFTADKVNVTFNEPVHFADLSCGGPTSWLWNFEGGTPATSTDRNPVVSYASSGIFNVSLTISDGVNSQTLTKPDYITVAQNILMANGTVTTCTGNFFDSGGPDNEYSNNENKVMTLVPSTAGAMLKVVFTQFETESEYDYLYIYDGSSVSAPQITGSPFNGTSGPGVVTASNAAGALTFKFTSDGSVTRVGWSASLECEGGPAGHTISGAITYPNTGNTPMDNVAVDLKNESGSVVSTTFTNASGIYSFTEINDGNYTLVPFTEKNWGGVSAADVLLFRKHIASILPLHGIYLACGDVNGSGSLTASDVLLIKKRIVSIIADFPVGDWLFDNVPVTVNGNDVIEDFNGIVYGDANASYTWTNADAPWLSVSPEKTEKAVGGTTVAIEAPETGNAGTVVVPLIVSSVKDLGAFQFTLRYDPSKLSFSKVTGWFPGIEEVLVANPQPGALSFIWAADVEGISMTDAPLCHVVFNRMLNEAADISWSNHPTRCEWFDYQANPLEIGFIKSSPVSGQERAIADNETLRVYPNPGSGLFHIALQTDTDDDVTVLVYSATGFEVARILLSGAGLNNPRPVDLSHLSEGIYFVQVLTVEGKMTKKLVVRK